ncbi:Stk1 family PASTA domain-containing Ser/Thr kinase [Vallitalea pronyensis]|uniref:non-specific serine/threonine protein kinase n=1 Tax=Vallitalea pronyensis TaxID=1348613 RepID=A0A8J8MJQ8_9FIRM|nr:Stk1 family PASTA domain-containing Ser/Thr kinase [Vallitalea pronyensis]QUI22925.1 Stk1 family PASTA domain-containing Ser/Thr kinase [Vallitalea pronyensis]
MLQPGVILSGRYEIIEKIGSGGMSIVYKAKCNKLERFVAVKVLRDEFCTDEEFVRRFKVEAQSAASLSHHNIVNIYDVGNDKKIYYIVMELLEGITLKEYIKNNAPLSDTETIKIAASIASALEHAHDNHIIHRDIKPQNIIITKDGIAKVADFGIARVSTDTTIVVPSNASGSVHYISPEQARGGFSDEKSDLYSLGITMYEMATGTLPYQAESPVSVALQHIHEDLPKPSEKNDEIGKCLESIIIKATLKKAEFRYSSAAELMSDLKKANLTPEENFVNIRGVDDDAPTLFMSDHDMEKIWSEEEKQKEKRRETTDKPKSMIEKVVVFMGIISAIVFVSIVSFLLYNGLKDKIAPPKKISVPALQGYDIKEAEEILEEHMLGKFIKEERYDDQYALNEIIEQEPQKDTLVDKNEVVSLVVSKGPPMCTVPDVTNFKFTTAQDRIRKENLKSKIITEDHDIVETGNVIRQSPIGNTKLRKNELVTIYVSNGKKEIEVRVPKIEGLTLSKAESNLNSRNLEIGATTYTHHDTIPKGIIISQNVKEDEMVKEDYEIDVVISLGRKITYIETLSVPDLLATGQTEGHVKLVLVNKGEENVVFKKLVKYEDFPLSVMVTGEGEAVLKAYLDDVFQYEETFIFTKEVGE